MAVTPESETEQRPLNPIESIRHNQCLQRLKSYQTRH